MFSNKKKFAEGNIATLEEVFTCRNQDTQNINKQVVKLFSSDFNRLSAISNSTTKKIAVADIIHNILNLYFEQNKDEIKELLSKSSLF